MSLTLDLGFADDDAAARDLIHRDLDRSLFVEAGAGTGKTTVLVDRVVELFATGRVSEPGRLVAITFTEAAAAELRDRIRRGLERAAADPAQPPERRRRCDAVVARIDDAVITTIHGFAQRILAEYPLEAGLPPVFEIDDDVRATVAFRERWIRFLDDLYADPDAEPDLVTVFTLGLVPARLQAIAEQFHARWDRLRVGPVEPPEIPAVDLEAVRAPLREAVSRLTGREHHADGLVRLLVAARAVLARLEGCTDDLAGLETLSDVTIPSNRTMGRDIVWNGTKAKVHDLVEAACDARAEALSAVRRAALVRLLVHLRAFTLGAADERRRAGRLEFHDLLVRARDLIRDDPAVRKALSASIDVVMIDEFQDTDPIQLEIAFLVAAADPSATPPARFEDVPLTPGKVLVVGDPKQSIYRFRGADIALWDRTRVLFEDSTVLLTRNFRSVPHIVEWVNAVFDRLIGEGRLGAQPAYRPLAAARTSIDAESAVIVLGEPSDDRVGVVRQREAADVALMVATMRAERWRVRDSSPAVATAATRPVRYDDIALLVPTRTPLGEIERALDDAGIPYRVESRSLVWATDDVRELLEILTAVDDPADEVAVVAALRSPAFACSDETLVDYRLAGGHWDYRREPPDSLPADDPVVAGLAELRRLHDQRTWLPVHRVVETVIRERRLVELTMAQRRPRDHWRRLRFVLDQARAFVEAGGQSLAGFVDWARTQTDERAQVVETVVPEPDDDAVRILTVHGAKGLEFPIVVLAGLNAGGDSTWPAVLWSEAGPEVSVGPREVKFETAGYAHQSGESRDADDLEARRLLYVAATRAMDHLVVSLHHKVMNGAKVSHAQRLFEASADLAGLWRPAQFPRQLALAVDEQTMVTPPPIPTVAERARWVDRRRALLAATEASGPFTATAIAHAGDERGDSLDSVDGSRWGRPGGTAVGRAVHAVLEAVDLTEWTEEEVARLAAVTSASEGMADAAGLVAVLAESALRSPVVEEARQSGRWWREVYVGTGIGSAGRLVEGYVDLLVDTADGLVVVDYKTDAARADAAVEAAAARYAPQAATYAMAAAAITGRPVARCVLVFCRAGSAVEHTITGDALTAAITGVQRLLGTDP